MPKFGQVHRTSLPEYFVDRFNLEGRDAEYKKNRPTLDWLSRDADSLKRGVVKRTLRIADGFSGSPDWVAGNKNYRPTKAAQWILPDAFGQYGRLTFDAQDLMKNPLGTLLDTKEVEIEGVRNSMLNTLEFEIWNDQTLAFGQVATVSGTTTVTATLANADEVYNFPIGAIVNANTARDGSGTAHTNEYQVTDISPVAGTVTLTRVTDNTSPIANNDYVHVVGSANQGMPGISKFIPSADPADTLFGVTRTGNPGLSGWRFPFVGSISETVQTSFARMGRYVNRSAGRYMVALSTLDWLKLSLELEGRQFHDQTSVGRWGLEGLIVRTMYGPITCLAIPQMTDGRGYILDWSAWTLLTLGNLPHVIDEDGLTMIRGGIDTPDGYKNGDLFAVQFRIWKILLCDAPIGNCTFPTA